jgi:deoxyribodipyrimidine photo-lyase
MKRLWLGVMIDQRRIRILNEKPVRSEADYVLYWMQQSQRPADNAALSAAIAKANQLKLPLRVCFGLMDDYPEATERHYTFMLQGLADTGRQLAKMGADFVVRRGSPKDVAMKDEPRAAVVVADRGYLRHQRQWRDHVADRAGCRVVEVEADVVVPVETASNKQEVAARTLRPKIHRLWKEFLVPQSTPKLEVKWSGKVDAERVDVDDIEQVMKSIRCDRQVRASPVFTGGPTEAGRRLEAFFEAKKSSGARGKSDSSRGIVGYAEGRNEPWMQQSSKMSPYLQYGQVSPVTLALAALESGAAANEDRDSYVEELIVRRELSHNYCFFQPDYDKYSALPGWARASLEKHSKDKRPTRYTREQLRTAQTHDRYWNAAQMEMVVTGFMHNYMRMYWGKKILEWTDTPEEAFEIALQFNNRYFLDGLNANSYGNVAWTFGLFDRPWGERAIFGVIRYMNAAGLERKFEIDRYVEQVDDLCREHAGKPLVDAGTLFG